MGVSGSGKSTVGASLAEKLGLPFYDADDFHPKANINKMADGKPLDDVDRLPWLETLADYIQLWENQKGAVLACSALKSSYRSILGEEHTYVYLKGSFEFINQRLQQRTNHFMPESLLRSQFETLEEPSNALTVSIDDTIDNIVNSILDAIKKHGN